MAEKIDTINSAATGDSIGPSTNRLQRYDTAPEDNVGPTSPPTLAPVSQPPQTTRTGTTYSSMSRNSMPPPGSVLTGKQEHYLKRELLSQQTEFEIGELAHPTALQRFGAPFRSDAGELAPQDSDLPILRYMFVNHIRNFPFLDQAREKEFWQDKLQVFLESFANKHISSSADRLEETKRGKLAVKAKKLTELYMVSGLPTASGYEERIRFSEMEIVDRGANEQGLIVNAPEGHDINGWDINIAAVRTINIKRHVKKHAHAEFLLRVKQGTKPEIYVARRYGDFVRLHKRLRAELPGKVLPPLPRKNKAHSFYRGGSDDDDDSGSETSLATQDDGVTPAPTPVSASSGFRSYLPSNPFSSGHRRSASQQSPVGSPRGSVDEGRTGHLRVNSSDLAKSSRSSLSPNVGAGSPMSGITTPLTGTILYREEQRVSLRAFLRGFLQTDVIAQSAAMHDFLTTDPLTPDTDDHDDIERRARMDGKRMAEQKRFYEIAQQRARELDVHMEQFRRDVVESNGLTKLFAEIKVKNSIQELAPEYQKFAEWLRIEVAATLYHIFLAEDNSPELFAQAKRIHSLVPYGTLKQVIRFANPAAVMAGVLDLFLAQPFGAKSLLQRIFGYALGDGIKSVQTTIDRLAAKIEEPLFCDKIRNFVDADEDLKSRLRREAKADDVDLLSAVLSSEHLDPLLDQEDTARAYNAYAAWNTAVENVHDDDLRQGAELFAHLKQLLRLHTRKRDKLMMMQMIEESTTLRLFRDLFSIFYEPLVRVYKSANVYNSITDFARFADDAIAVIEKCQRQDMSADPNQTVQAFIDLCQRHEASFYKFVHEVHTHDNGLFEQLMSWIEGILTFLRTGPRGGGKLDMNALFSGAVEMKSIDPDLAIREINGLMKWQEARKKWHSDKTRQKMAADAGPRSASAGIRGGGSAGSGAGLDISGKFSSSDFGINALDLQDLAASDEEDEDDWDSEGGSDDEDADPIEAERKRRAKKAEILRGRAGEPVKPEISEIAKMRESFLSMLKMVLAE